MSEDFARYRLEPFDTIHGDAILTWVESREDRDAWASQPDLELAPALFRSWHSDPDVHPYVLLEADEPCGYGEVWTDEAEAEAELAHVVVAPALRGRGIGRRLVRLLAERAAALGFDEIWVRVLPSNRPALASYRRAGFVRATPQEEASFNSAQPRRYVWMRLHDAGAG